VGAGLGGVSIGNQTQAADSQPSTVIKRVQADPAVPLEILFLGTGSPGIDLAECRGGACEIVFAQREPLLFDLGHLGLAHLLQAGLHPADIRHLFFTHTYHYDHFCDFAGFIMCRTLQRDAGPLQVYGPADTRERVSLLLSQVYAEDIRAQNLIRRNLIQFHTLDKDTPVQNAQWTVRAVHVKHGPNALGFRVEAGGRSVTISGDIAEPQAGPGRRIAGFPCESIEQLAQGSDVFIMDACPMHSTPQAIGEAAVRAKPKKVILTHVRDGASGQECRKVVQQIFGGEVAVAENLSRVRVGA
jgi:ribonuclease BN (tRNA processing enzyme)